MAAAIENKVDSIIHELQLMGTESTKKVLMKHGAKEPFFGVKIEDMKKILKREKHNHELAMSLYETGISDAMYLAGLMADGSKMSREQLQHWVELAYWSMLSDYTVPWNAAESAYGFELALEWIDSEKETVASAGWATLSMLAGMKVDAELDLKTYDKLIDRVVKTIHQSENRVRYAMNGFLIATAAGIISLTDKAIEAAGKMGKVTVEMNGTACKVPSVEDYVAKIEAKGLIGRKRKSLKC